MAGHGHRTCEQLPSLHPDAPGIDSSTRAWSKVPAGFESAVDFNGDLVYDVRLLVEWCFRGATLPATGVECMSDDQNSPFSVTTAVGRLPGGRFPARTQSLLYP